MRRISWLAAPLVAGLVAWPAPAAAQISVDSLIVTLSPQAGGASLAIPVHNDGVYAVRVHVQVRDWLIDDEGRHHFQPNGTTPESCAGRLRVASETLRIGAGETATLRVHHDGGEDDRCRNIVFLRVGDSDIEIDGEAVALVISTGVKVFVER